MLHLMCKSISPIVVLHCHSNMGPSVLDRVSDHDFPLPPSCVLACVVEAVPNALCLLRLVLHGLLASVDGVYVIMCYHSRWPVCLSMWCSNVSQS